MNDTKDKNAVREQCRVCGGAIEQGEDREEMTEDGEVSAHIHTNCA